MSLQVIRTVFFPVKGPYTRPMCTDTPNQATSVEQQMQR